jgi:hypothetical protein
VVLCTGRQVGKSTSEAADGIVQAACVPNFKILYMTPLFEQVRRLSSNHVKKFINQSPVRRLMIGTSKDASVLQKTLANGSILQFSFGALDVGRVRGVTADFIKYDEVQDMDSAHFPVIGEAMSHSRWSLTQYAGTPKTLQSG